MQPRFRLILALACLFAVAEAGAIESERMGVKTLRPDAATGEIYLEEVGEGGDLMRLLEMQRGTSVLLKTSYQVKRVSVGNPDLLDVVVLSPREIQLVAKGVGATNVLIWDTRGRPQASIEVELGTTQTYLQRELRRILGNDGITVDSAGSATIVGGTVVDALAVEHAMAVAEAFVAGDKNATVVNLLQAGGNQQVMLKVVIAEMSRVKTMEFGANFNALIDAGTGQIRLASLLGDLTATGSDPNILLPAAANLFAGFSNFGALEQLGVFLDIMDEKGFAKVLAEPTLVARSGETASFLVGGEVPLLVTQNALDSVSVEYKPFGVALEFTPTVLRDGRIHLTVFPEVSRPDFTNSVEGFPQFITRRVSTSVELQPGQSLMIAGLLSEDLRDTISQYPLLGQIPLLGGLFRVSKYVKDETELVILVTPELVKPLGSEPVQLPTDSFIDPSPFEFYLYGWIEGRAPAAIGTAGLIGEAGYRISPDVEGDFDE
jgi:pilus assembly protein CpaC